ncbi:unnamed protein product [Caenorhabditis bovis]|uniref:Uncharacterized protein n=1 Tax=Caenorhabditis bovis TaxID=2654633 RepID=A0A8S1EQ75_9PELO|nr:unnamed protein product [Caenorhabditis bovis]
MTILDSDDLSPGEIVFSADETNDASGTIFGDLFSPQKPSSSTSLTGLIILCIILTIVVVVFFGCYLMMRFMHRALSRDDSKDMLAVANPYNNVVMHSKRVYEIQAEEGCFNGAPDPLDPGDLDEEPTQEPQSCYIDDVEDVKIKKPETGDLKTIRQTESWNDDPKMMLRKKQKVHKDSVCAFLFRPNPPEPRMV